jgi:hypothetical protein
MALASLSALFVTPHTLGSLSNRVVPVNIDLHVGGDLGIILYQDANIPFE